MSYDIGLNEFNITDLNVKKSDLLKVKSVYMRRN